MRAVVAVVLVTVCLAASGCGGSSSSGSRGASFVPASVAAYVAIDTDPSSSQWRHADGLSRRFPGRDDAVGQLERSARSQVGLDYEEDVEPALGPELDLAWLDLEDDGENVVGLMQPRDTKAFERALAKGNAADPGAPLVHELVDGWEVIADERAKIEAFKRARAADGPVLADDDAYRQAWHGTPSDALVKGYVDGARVMQRLRAAVPAADRDYLRKLGELDWLATALGTSPEGVRFDLTVRGRAGKLLRSSGEAADGFHLSLPKALPAGVLAYVGFHGTAGALSGLEGNPALAGARFEPVRSTVRKVGRLLEGENALYVRRGPGREPEVTLVTTPGAGRDGAAILDRVLEDTELGNRIEFRSVAGVDARRLRLADGLALVYGNVGDRLVVTNVPEGLAGVATPGSKLGRDAAFADAVDASDVPAKVQSFVYVDVRGGLGLVERLSSAPIPGAIKRNLGPLRSAVEYAASRPSEVQLTLFVRIG